MQNDDAWIASGQLNEWIRFADAKAAALLATSGILGGFLVSWVPLTRHGVVDGVCGTFFDLAAVAVVLSTLVSLQALLPRTGARGKPTSLLFFDHVARQFADDPDGFAEAFHRIAEDDPAMRREIVGQIWANSIVARRKFRRLTGATWLIGVALLSAGMTVLLDRI